MYPDDKLFITRSTTWESVEAGILEPDYVDNLGYTPGTPGYLREVMGEIIEESGEVFNQNWKMIGPEHPVPESFVAVYGAIDVGTIDPTAIIIVGLDTRGAVWVLREYYQARAHMDQWIDKVGEWTTQYNVRQWFADSDITVRMMKRVFQNTKFPYKKNDAADIAVTYINRLIKNGMFYIDPSCRGLLSEMTGYRYKELWTGEEVTFLQKTQQHQADHAIDALRYAILPLSSAAAAQSYGQSVKFSIG